MLQKKLNQEKLDHVLYDILDDWENDSTPFYTLETVHLYYKELDEFDKLCDSNKELEEYTKKLFKELGF